LRMDFMAIVAATPTAELLEHLRDLAATPGEKAIAKSEVIRLEWQKRPPGERLSLQDAYKQAFEAIPVPSFDEERRKLREIIVAGEKIEALLASLARGREVSLVDMMTAQRAGAGI
jgi:hypothetical protein